MKNKYQEALETLKAIPIGDCFLLDYKSIKGCGCQLETGKALETLQELIDKYYELEAKMYGFVYDIKTMNEEEYEEFILKESE